MLEHSSEYKNRIAEHIQYVLLFVGDGMKDNVVFVLNVNTGCTVVLMSLYAVL